MDFDPSLNLEMKKNSESSFSSSCGGAYFESWVKLLGFLFLNIERISGYNMRYVLGIHCPKSRVGICPSNLVGS